MSNSYVEKLRLSRAQIHSLQDELGNLKAEHLACDVQCRRLERELDVKNDELENLTKKLWFSKDSEANAIAKYDQALEYNRELEAEVEKLMGEQLAWDFERRKMERKLEVKNDELEDLTRKFGFIKDTEANAIKKYEQALEYNREVEAKVEELKRGFDTEKEELLGRLSDLKDELMQREVELETDSVSESQVKDVEGSSKSRTCQKLAKPTVFSKGMLVGENETACHKKRDSPACIQNSDRDDFASCDANNHTDESSSNWSNHEQDAKVTDIQIFMKFLTGRTIPMVVKPCFTVKSLKYKIQDKEGILPHHQHLSFKRKQLQDRHTLADYNIQKYSTILVE